AAIAPAAINALSKYRSSPTPSKHKGHRPWSNHTQRSTWAPEEVSRQHQPGSQRILPRPQSQRPTAKQQKPSSSPSVITNNQRQAPASPTRPSFRRLGPWLSSKPAAVPPGSLGPPSTLDISPESRSLHSP